MDACDPSVTVSCNPPSGQVFPAGVTTVTCSSTDACGNNSTCSFTLTVAPCAESCTPGFWCGGAGRELWDVASDGQWAQACGGTNPFTSSDTFCGPSLGLFNCQADVQDSTMKALLCKGGGYIRAQKAARDVIAAYLNASCDAMAFGMEPAAVAALWNDAVAGVTTFASVHNTLAALNDPTSLDECPLERTRLATLAKAGADADRPFGAEETLEAPGSVLDLYRPTPNPFVHATRLAFAVSSSTGDRVEIGVYDVAGRRIRALVSGQVNPGRHETGWDGRNAEGVRVTNGMYFIHISVGQVRRTVHVVYLR